MIIIIIIQYVMRTVFELLKKKTLKEQFRAVRC